MLFCIVAASQARPSARASRILTWWTAISFVRFLMPLSSPFMPPEVRLFRAILPAPPKRSTIETPISSSRTAGINPASVKPAFVLSPADARLSTNVLMLSIAHQTPTTKGPAGPHAAPFGQYPLGSWNDPTGYDSFATFEQFVTGVLQKIENMHFPGLRPRGRQSGGLSHENINRMRNDFQRGVTGHLEKFQNSLRALVNAYNESYEAQTSPEQGNKIRATLRGEYDQALQNASQTGFSESAILNTDRGDLPPSLPSEAQSTFNRITGEPPAGADGATSGTEEAPAEGAGEVPEVPPKSY